LAWASLSSYRGVIVGEEADATAGDAVEEREGGRKKGEEEKGRARRPFQKCKET